MKVIIFVLNRLPKSIKLYSLYYGCICCVTEQNHFDDRSPVVFYHES